MINGRIYDVLDIVKRLQPVSYKRVAEELGVKPATAAEYLGELRERGLAWSTGRGPSAAWVDEKPVKSAAARALSPTKAAIVEVVKKNQPVARRHIAEILGMNKRTLSVHLDELKARGLVESTGMGSTACWIVVTPRSKRPAVSDVFSLAQSMGVA